jgi:hypothetical protein
VVTRPEVTGPERGEKRRVRDLVRAVVENVAPEETRYFDDLSAEFFDRPDRMLNPRRERDEPTSAGDLAEVAALVTGVVLAAVSSTLSDEIKDLIAAAGRCGHSVLRRRRAARRLRARRDDVLNAEPPASKARQAAEHTGRLAIVIGIDVERAEEIGVAVFIELSEHGSDT